MIKSRTKAGRSWMWVPTLFGTKGHWLATNGSKIQICPPTDGKKIWVVTVPQGQRELLVQIRTEAAAFNYAEQMAKDGSAAIKGRAAPDGFTPGDCFQVRRRRHLRPNCWGVVIADGSIIMITELRPEYRISAVEEVPEQAIPLDLVDSASAIPTPAKLVLVALTLAIRTGR